MSHLQLQLEPIWQPATQQRVYRQILQAMAFPGRIADLAFAEAEAALAALATLLDHTTTLCDLGEVLAPHARQLLEARSAPHDTADYILAQAGSPPEAGFLPRLGTLAGPDQSATLLLAGQQIGRGNMRLELSGPGVQATTLIELSGFAPGWFAQRATWVANFPLGVDLLLTDRSRLVALPRTTQVRTL